ncbi:MAG: M56 family metallopeptidase [Cyanobacteria bacterium J06632_3]
MMHSHMLVLAAVLAYLSRLPSQWLIHSPQPWTSRWASTLSAFVVPPLFLLTTAIAIVMMGPNGPLPLEGWVSFGVSSIFLVVALSYWVYLSWVAVSLRKQLRQYPRQSITTASQTVVGRVTQATSIFSAQVGFWSSELVVSQGLLDELDDEHLEAVLAHEAGHDYYRDTFWFFWLGGLRRLTRWLPYTDELWQELLLLREMRADRWATRSVDKVVLAEALMNAVTASITTPMGMAESVHEEAAYAGLSFSMPRCRLARRIDALLAEDEASTYTASLLPQKHWLAITLSLSPLLTIPFHH